MSAQEIRLVRRPEGRSVAGDFALHDAPMPALRDGDALVELNWLSIDPYLHERAIGERAGPRVALGSCMPGRAIGRVIDGALPGGTLVVGELGWRSHAVAPASSLTPLPADERLSPTCWLGVLGVPGFTAWISLFRLHRLEAGQTLLVTSAAGTVGSIAVQLAHAAGARVVGIVGGTAKVEWLRGMGATAVDRNDPRGLAHALADACQGGGADALLDLAGGPVLEAALACAKPRARVVLAGHVGSYGTREATIDADLVLSRRLTVHGLLIHDHAADFAAAREALRALALQGRVTVRETVHEGLSSAPAALQALLEGRGIGKHLVRL